MDEAAVTAKAAAAVILHHARIFELLFSLTFLQEML
jgi:hypothetical protein